MHIGHIVIVGNPVDGLEFHGPFGAASDANDWADDNVHQSLDWWVAELNAPFVDLNAEHHEAIVASEAREAEYWRRINP